MYVHSAMIQPSAGNRPCKIHHLPPARGYTRKGKTTMTRQQKYKELERMYAEVDWSNKESVARYNEAARRYREMVAEQGKEGEGQC